VAEVLPLQLMALYQELVDTHLSRTPGDEPGGAPFRRSVRGKAYWYATARSGARVVQRYIGLDTDETRARVALIEEARAATTDFRRRAGDMVAQLRAARLPVLDAFTGSVLAALSGRGAFDLGATLVGTVAFRLYDGELGRRISREAPALTQNIDIASYEGLSLALATDAIAPIPGDLALAFADLDLEPVPTIDTKGRATRWRRRGGAPVLDVLAPSFAADEGLVWLEALGLWAQSLHFLGFLLADPIPAVALHRHGVLVRIPRPERYAIHKLIIAHERRGPGLAKRRKDLAQARALILALAEDRPAELATAHETALSHGPRWREAIDLSLAKMPDARALLHQCGAGAV
jgi:hypothetical protein